MVRRITNINWDHRVYKVASRCETMGQATTLCRENGVAPCPSLMVLLNPQIKRKAHGPHH